MNSEVLVGSKREDFPYVITATCDNCGAKYVVFDTDPDIPEMHRVCDTCFMPMCVRNDYYYWRRGWKRYSQQCL